MNSNDDMQPRNVGEIIGLAFRDTITKLIREQLLSTVALPWDTQKNARVPCRFAFIGDAKCGKSMAARILSKSCFCAKEILGTPCGTCAQCKKFEEGYRSGFIDLEQDNRVAKSVQELERSLCIFEETELDDAELGRRKDIYPNFYGPDGIDTKLYIPVDTESIGPRRRLHRIDLGADNAPEIRTIKTTFRDRSATAVVLEGLHLADHKKQQTLACLIDDTRASIFTCIRPQDLKSIDKALLGKFSVCEIPLPEFGEKCTFSRALADKSGIQILDDDALCDFVSAANYGVYDICRMMEFAKLEHKTISPGWTKPSEEEFAAYEAARIKKSSEEKLNRTFAALYANYGTEDKV